MTGTVLMYFLPLVTSSISKITPYNLYILFISTTGIRLRWLIVAMCKLTTTTQIITLYTMQKQNKCFQFKFFVDDVHVVACGNINKSRRSNTSIY